MSPLSPLKDVERKSLAYVVLGYKLLQPRQEVGWVISDKYLNKRKEKEGTQHGGHMKHVAPSA